MGFRSIREISYNDDSLHKDESSDPLLTQVQTRSLDAESDLESGVIDESEQRAYLEPDAFIRTKDSSSPKRRSWFQRWIWTGASSSKRRLEKSNNHTSCTCWREQNSTPSKSTRLRHQALRKILRVLAFSLMLLGLIQFVVLAFGLVFSFFPSDFDIDSDDTLTPTESLVSDDLKHWPTDFTADIHPISCHSHNDYWRKEPLFNALQAGCTGVEADVWLFNNDLYVGHTSSSLTTNRTLRSLYVDPIVAILDKQNPTSKFHPELDTPRNGVFDTDPRQTLILLIDFKQDGHTQWPFVFSQLEPLRQGRYLTHFDGTKVVPGPVTVVLTGNAPFDKILSQSSYRDMFYDAPLDHLADFFDSSNETTTSSPYLAENSYYASVDFRATIGVPFFGKLSHKQLTLMWQQIQTAHDLGLKVRYWNVPAWPTGMRDYLWRTLMREGVDILNVDDLKSASKGRWAWRSGRRHRGGRRKNGEWMDEDPGWWAAGWNTWT